MRQVLQSLRDGVAQVVDVPCPPVRPGHLLIQSRRTLISAGTERMLSEFGKATWIGKARQQPDKVRMMLEKIRADGLASAVEAVLDKLDQPVELGYCNVGTVIEVGSGVIGFEIGDRVLSNGRHAEVVCVPQNLSARIPDNVADETAVFGSCGAIALQGIRLAQPTLGECFLVSGLGLIGLLAVQLLKANGARVLGADFNPVRLKLAEQFGAETVDLGHEDLLSRAAAFSRGHGVDGVLLTASTHSQEPIHQAAQVSRQRGRIVLIGVTGLQLQRDDFYKKELSFQVSCSYGPGRYDAAYEEQGRDYPRPFVRWTEQRNFEAVLDMMSAGRLDVGPLVTHRFPLTNAAQAYDILGGKEPSLGVLLTMPDHQASTLRRDTIPIQQPTGRVPSVMFRTAGQPRGFSAPTQTSVTLGVIGAGGFASKVLLPAFRMAGCRLHSVASRGGVSAFQAAQKFGFAAATTNLQRLLDDSEINTIVIATRHDSHADLVCRALAAGKHVFVEKPLAITPQQLEQVKFAYEATQQRLKVMVGFNRRFAPQVQQMARLLRGVSEPKAFVMTVNSGMIPPEHWTQQAEIGGGRMIGEGCHFIDLLRFLAGQPVVELHTSMLGRHASGTVRDDKLTCTLTFADGSIGTLHYLANGHRSVSKERLEVFCGGRMLQLDNFLRLTGHGWPGFRKMNLWRQDKGHRAEVAAFCQAIQTGANCPIPFEEIVEVTQLSFGAVGLNVASNLHLQRAA